MARKCCCCIPLGAGVIFIGVITAIETLFSGLEMLGSGFAIDLDITFAGKAFITGVFVLAAIKPDKVQIRRMLLIVWMIGFAAGLIWFALYLVHV